MGNALVTGAAGFLGSHLCERLLEDGVEVLGIDALTDYYDERIKLSNLSRCLEFESFRFLRKDLNSIELGGLLETVETVFHLAAQPGVRASWGREFRVYLDANVAATQKLLEAARGLADPPRIVYSSSSSVYGETTSLPMREDHLPRPHSPYGVTKLAAEHLCRLYHRNHGLPCVSLRYFTVYGPRQRPDMAFHRFFAAILAGEPIEVYGDGTQTRDFTYVDDAVRANLQARDYTGSEEVFNIGGGSRVSLNEAIETVYHILSRPPDVRHADPVRGDVSHTWADTARARSELGFEPRVALREGLEKQLAWHERLGTPKGEDA